MRAAIGASLLISLAVACAPSDAAKESGDWAEFRDGFLEFYFEANPSFAASQGRHEFDGRLPDWSGNGIRAKTASLHDARDETAAIDPANLEEAERFERELLLARIDRDLFWLEEAEWPWRNPTYYRLDPNVYLTREYAPLEDRMRAYNRWARAVPEATRQIRANLRTPLPRTYVQIGRIRFGGLARYLEDDVPGVFESVGDQELRREFEEATDAAVRALSDLDAWLEGQALEATDGFALGPELFRAMLWNTERIDTSLEELEAIGRADLERNQATLIEACSGYAPGATVRQCMDRAAANKPDDGPVLEARRQLESLETVLRDRNLVTIPGSERAQVEEAPPHRRSNTAYIDIPGPYENGLPSTYYIAPPDPSWSEEDQAAYIPSLGNLLFISVHEVWPGHFLQFLHANRAPSILGRVFVGYAFAEGWAHYAEELMWEAGLGEDDPEVHIGQLENALLRNVRFLSALGLHTGGMSVEESERMFRDEAFQDPGTARQQAARGTYDPAYLNYTMGKLMIRRLRDDWLSLQPDATLRDFHDRFLSFGGPPIPLVRKAMLGEATGSPF
jgi:hypothetical protein